MAIFFTILVIISAFITFVLALFFLVTPRGSAPENRTLALLLFIFGMQIIYSFFTSAYAFQYFMDWHKSIFLIRQTGFLTGPLVYFYVASFLKKKELSERNFRHFIPFACSMIFLSVFYKFQDSFVIWESIVDLYDTILILASNFIYIVLSALCLRSSGLSFQNLFKTIRIAPHNTWLQILLLGYMVIWMVNLNSFAIYMIVKRPGWCAYTLSVYALVFFVFVNLLMFLILIKPDIYYILTKYRNSKLEDGDKEDGFARLNCYMMEHKPYLNPDITLELLASELGMNPRSLSQIINESFGKSYKNFILDYRIKESMKILSDKKARNLTILEVLYQVGFNSKSAFNNQFKLYTNHTPQEYRAKFVN
ncbi:MAG: AraC family transcriptional regulator [Alphaproteobacteria bacterium]|nr:AraC family transcriptional regulator [Alphaproteobacteria bacterium]